MCGSDRESQVENRDGGLDVLKPGICSALDSVVLRNNSFAQSSQKRWAFSRAVPPILLHAHT